ncbi:hypothetical protein [Vibrio sp. M260118]|uniref:hypothetical protein n=1 Tax=Vibrio sp. M260118 TaxID=3020896 RepID=UPI002F3EFF89
MKDGKDTPPTNEKASDHLEQDLERISEMSFEALNELERLMEKASPLENER